MEDKENQYYLFPSGLMFWTRKIELAFKCPFDFELYPNDKQVCPIAPIIKRYSNDTITLIPNMDDLELEVIPTY